MNTSSNLCRICPRNCSVDRKLKFGYCKQGLEIEIAWHGLHLGEEPPISGSNGSGTVFFSGCNLSCVYCQNWQISQKPFPGEKLTPEELAAIMLDLQQKNAHNINLVTPTIWTIQLIEAIKIAKDKGLFIPIVWNSNGYEKVEIVRSLKGIVDIFLPDYKYADDNLAMKYSDTSDYSVVASEAINEMQEQVGDLRINETGIAQKGLIVRHLIIPDELENSYRCLKYIRSLSENIHLSLMSQFNPTYHTSEYSTINRELNNIEFDAVMKVVEKLDFHFGWNQEFGEPVKCFNPDFTKNNPFVQE